MNTRWILLVLVLAAAARAQTESAIVRDGGYWEQTLTGVLPLQGVQTLRIATRGSVSARGVAGGGLSYTIRKRVRARDEAQAREMLRSIVLKSERGLFQLQFPARVVEATASVRASVGGALRELALESRGGDVEARDLAAAVRADTGGGRVSLDRIQGEVLVRTGGGAVQLGNLGRGVKCYSDGGPITAELLGRDAELNTGGGEIFVREAQGRLHASTGGGNIRVLRAAYGLAVATAGGVIDVGRASGVVTAETGAGGIKLLEVSGRLRASTAAGRILARLSAATPLEDSSLVTGHGDITVFIPSNLALTVEAINESAVFQKIVSEFPEIRLRPESRGARAEVQGSLNGGGPVLRLAAAGGTIYLRRQN